ncbi:MAG: YgdI/YgdR family lipoprotein [Verrucomicrobiae bacterium]|nr:YgdI/YgdR family lipoprotein [Verrucomicrobiae bacterium]
MKRVCWLVLLVALLGCGCARRYVITLHNGNTITALGKPRMEGGMCVFKDASGQWSSVPAGRVREIAPRSMAGGGDRPPLSKPRR